MRAALVQRLASLVAAEAGPELPAPVGLDIVCVCVRRLDDEGNAHR